MKIRISTFRCVVVTLVLSLLVISVARSGQQVDSSLTDSDIEISELKVALDQVVGENRHLRDALSSAEINLREMRRAFAVTSGEAEVFRRQALELKKRFEALGSSATGDTRDLEERLLNGVSDLQQAVADKKRLAAAIIRLSEAVLRFSSTATSDDAEARLTLEAEVRNANQVLAVGVGEVAEGISVPPTLTDGIVISVREELALVVANLGRMQGVRIGMPFQVTRDNRIVGLVRMVDVRERLGGAVIQNLSSEKDRIKVGDRLKVNASP